VLRWDPMSALRRPKASPRRNPQTKYYTAGELRELKTLDAMATAGQIPPDAGTGGDEIVRSWKPKRRRARG